VPKDGDTGLPIPGDRAGGNIAVDEESLLSCRCQLSCINLMFYTHRCATTGTYMDGFLPRIEDMVPYAYERGALGKVLATPMCPE
jgi:hypothetical protein